MVTAHNHARWLLHSSPPGQVDYCNAVLYGVSVQVICQLSSPVYLLCTLGSVTLNPSKSEAIIFGTHQCLNSFPRPSVIIYSVHQCPSAMITSPPLVSLWTQISRLICVQISLLLHKGTLSYQASTYTLYGKSCRSIINTAPP